METIKLIVAGVALDLPPNFKIDREEETSLFNRELSRKDFTYPATIPLTDRNNAALGLVKHLDVSEKNKEVKADFYFSDIFFDQVTVRILNVNTLSQTIELSLIGVYGTFARVIGDKKLADLQLGGDRLIGTTTNSGTQIGSVQYQRDSWVQYYEMTVMYYGCDTAGHMKAVMDGTVNADYFFYPAVDTKQNISILSDGAKSLLNYYDWSTGAFADPIIEYFNSEFAVQIPQRLFWVPFFKVLYVLRKCFEENGFTVTGDVFSDSALQACTLYNTSTFCTYKTHETPWVSGSGTDVGVYKTLTISNRSTTIHPQDHMPDMSVLDFINEVAKAWNLQYKIDMKMQTVSIIQVKKFMNVATVIDFTGRAEPTYELTFEDDDLADGYKFSFSKDPSETLFGDKQKDSLESFPVVASVNTVAELTGTYNASDLAYIRSQNSYYQYGGQDWIFYSWNGFDMQTIENASNPIEITTKVCPIVSDQHTILRTYSTSDGVRAEAWQLYLPTSNIGIKGAGLIWFKHPTFEKFFQPEPLAGQVNSEAIKIQPLICYWHGIRPNLSGDYPYAASFNFDVQGTQLQAANHFWDSPDHNGLYYNQWKQWTDNLASAVIVKFDVLYRTAVDDMVDYESSIIRIGNQQYLLKKASKPLPYPNISNLELVRI